MVALPGMLPRSRSRTLWLVTAFGTACAADPVPAGTSTTSEPTTESTGVPVDCNDYTSTNDVGPAVTVTVRQQGIGPIWFRPHGCGGTIPFEVTAIDGDARVPHLLSECSPELCDDFVGASDCHQGCNDCAPPGATRLEIGGLGEGAWSGAWLVPLEMVEQCAAGDACQTTCQRRDQAPAGRYRIALEIFKLCTGGCECEDAVEGQPCNLYGGTQLGYPETFFTEIDYPAQTEAEIFIAD